MFKSFYSQNPLSDILNVHVNVEKQTIQKKQALCIIFVDPVFVFEKHCKQFL